MVYVTVALDSVVSTVHDALLGPIVISMLGRNAPGSPSIRRSCPPDSASEKPASVVPLITELLPVTILTSRMKGKITCLRMTKQRAK